MLIKFTKHAKLKFKKTWLPLIGYVDASWADDKNDSKSQSGYCFLLAGVAISGESSKQQTVATSSAEAGYIALTEGAREVYSLQYLIDQSNCLSSQPTTIYCDNQSAQQIAEYRGKYSRTKHIHYKYHFIRQAIEEGSVRVKYLQTNEMVADKLTKSLPKFKHYFCFSNFGINFN